LRRQAAVYKIHIVEDSMATKIMRVAAAMRACVLVACLLGAASVVQAQTLRWGTFNTVASFGAGNTAASQTLVSTVAGTDRGSGAVSLTLGVAGGTASWNGFGIGRNDDGYFSGPDMPQAGITMTTGAPGYNGGIPAISAVSFATGYNAAGGPAGLPAPPSDRAAVYFDVGSGATMTAQMNFAALVGGSLPAGSWIFIDNVDQGERLVLTGPSGWISTVHAGDSTLPRPASMFNVAPVSSPTFPVCGPAVAMTLTTLQLDGRYGDVSTTTPTCSNVPVPVVGVTVGYTKGMDSVGVWIRTAIDVTSLSLTAVDVDASPANAPDNNFSLGLAVISATAPLPVVPLAVATPVPSLDALGLALLVGLVLLTAATLRRPTASKKNSSL
jgi:hypothetical protein